ncbi:MAG: NAD-dependent succinate-semialdehyde dehydrogenase [Patescibacteria group bacterium]
MPLQSINPATLQLNAEFDTLTDEVVKLRVEEAATAYQIWSQTTLNQRCDLIRSLGDAFRANKDALAGLITTEMGCPISQALTEVEKCAAICDYYADNAANFLSPKAQANKSDFIHYNPVGIVFHIAPWNYPLYLAIRPVIPALIAGNTVLVKHASNVPQISLFLNELFEQAGFDQGVFKSLLISSSQTEPIIAHDQVAIITLIGSENAGSKVGALAGKYIKKCIMELGGSDAFIVFEDADLVEAAQAAAFSRLRNTGQSCNAAKRFIVAESVFEVFVNLLKLEFEKYIPGDPSLETTNLGPLATKDSLNDLMLQVNDSVKQGAEIVLGGKLAVADQPGLFYQPTILTEISTDMPVWREEVFGPVAPVIPFFGLDEAVRLANDHRYGLGASVWTKNPDIANQIIPKLEAGNVYINGVVRGDPKLPFGGVKKSGYGREFGEIGLHEFCNIKTVVNKL